MLPAAASSQSLPSSALSQDRNITTNNNNNNNNYDEKTMSSTYRDMFGMGNTIVHGNLVTHYGNKAFLGHEDTSSTLANPRIKTFLAPSYLNEVNKYHMSNQFSDHYVSAQCTSDANLLKRSLTAAPQQTKLSHLYKVKTFPIAQSDPASVYEQDYLNKRVDDYFVSHKPLKTDTINMRDTIARLMEFADHMRNMSYDTAVRRNFNQGDMDMCSQLFSALIVSSESLMVAYNKLNLSAREIKKICEDLAHPQRVIDHNLADRHVKPNYERVAFLETENSIKEVSQRMNECCFAIYLIVSSSSSSLRQGQPSSWRGECENSQCFEGGEQFAQVFQRFSFFEKNPLI